MTTLQEARMTTLQEAVRKALELGKKYAKCLMMNQAPFDEALAALAQQGATKNCPQPEICGSKECEFCRDTAAPAPVEQRCTYCDGTGDVHSIDGEWRGTCHCAAAPAPQPAQGGDYANAFSDGWEAAMKSNAAALQSAQPKQEPLTDEAIYSIVLSKFKCVPLPYDIRLTRAIEASHGINGMVEAATRPAIDAASKQGGQHD